MRLDGWPMFALRIGRCPRTRPRSKVYRPEGEPEPTVEVWALASSAPVSRRVRPKRKQPK